MQTLTKQEQRVFNFIVAHRGATTKDIERELGITCPSTRITYLRDKGVNIRSIGQKKYPGSRPFECYEILGVQAPKKRVIEFLPDGSVREVYLAA